MTHKIFILFLFLSISSNSLAGSLTGKITSEGKIKPSDSVVLIDHDFQQIFSVARKFTLMDQANMQFHPFALPILEGTTIVFSNNDSLIHNIYSPSPAAIDQKTKNIINFEIHPNEILKKKFNLPGEILLLCNIHQNMEAYILVLKNPFFAIPDKNGEYKIENIPSGEYKVKVWNKYHHDLSQKVIILNE